jgi:hypothetical protein
MNVSLKERECGGCGGCGRRRRRRKVDPDTTTAATVHSSAATGGRRRRRRKVDPDTTTAATVHSSAATVTIITLVIVTRVVCCSLKPPSLSLMFGHLDQGERRIHGPQRRRRVAEPCLDAPELGPHACGLDRGVSRVERDRFLVVPGSIGWPIHETIVIAAFAAATCTTSTSFCSVVEQGGLAQGQGQRNVVACPALEEATGPGGRDRSRLKGRVRFHSSPHVL